MPDTQKKKKQKVNPLRICHNFSAKHLKMAQTRGLSTADLLSPAKSFELDTLILPIEAEIGNKLKKITRSKQEGDFEKLQSKLLNGSWLSAGLSSAPSDLRAKQVAVQLFLMAMEEYQARDPRKNTNRSMPIWHRIYGGFGDSLRDLQSNFPSFIVISNITANCTNLKIEKVRDILEKYNAMKIPVLVITGGIDPYTMFATKLFYSLKYAIFMGSNPKNSN